jgi:hypothetical protein
MSSGWNVGFRRARRALEASVAAGVGAGDEGGPILEVVAGRTESPRLVSPEVVEGDVVTARLVPGTPEVGFTAFLDGAQASRVLGHIGSVPVVYGSVSAVIRVRRDRRMATYDGGPIVEQALYGPAALLPDIEGLVDTGPVEQDGAHPTLLLERAVHVVQKHRERVERELAERWCARESAALWIDGGLATASAHAVGVVTNHRTLYVDRMGLQVITRLGVGERTSVVRMAPAHRAPRLSWYLRIRESAGRGPLWGLVRVEIVDREGDVRERADVVSRWILAETAPLALPDARWDTLVYGVRDCEEYLRAVS